MLIALQDNSGVKGPHAALNTSCCFKHGELSGHLQIAQSFIQSALVCSQVLKNKKRMYNLSEQIVPLLDCAHGRKTVSPYSSLETYLFQFN